MPPRFTPPVATTRGSVTDPWSAGGFGELSAKQGPPLANSKAAAPPGQQPQRRLPFRRRVWREPLPARPAAGRGLAGSRLRTRPSSGRYVTSAHSASLMFY